MGRPRIVWYWFCAVCGSKSNTMQENRARQKAWEHNVKEHNSRAYAHAEIFTP
jgi:hypothetical protein